LVRPAGEAEDTALRALTAHGRGLQSRWRWWSQGRRLDMATAPQHADRTASEARRPGSGSRAGGVSRAERGNDGSPSGARRRRRLDAPRARQRDRPCFLAGDAQPSMLDAQAHAPVIGKQVRQRLLWSGRSGAAGSAVF